jgi:NTP pyrophosphatase (non-canonical NTP hydrolase)
MSIVIDQQLTQEILDFRTARDWEQFHTLRTLSSSLVIEAAELAELTRWTPDVALEHRTGEIRERLQEEVSDLLILMTYLVHDQGIDVASAIRQKLQLNGRKYPVDKFKGSSRKYNE